MQLNSAFRLTFAVVFLLVSFGFLTNCGGGDAIIGKPLIAQSQARKNHAGKRILIIVSTHGRLGKGKAKTGYWLSEVTHFYHVLARHGFAIDFASPRGGTPVMDPGSMNRDGVNRTFLADAQIEKALQSPLNPATVDATRYAAIYYAGGHGTMWDFPGADTISQLAARIYEQGGIVAAVCHGPAGLLNIRTSKGQYLIKGRRVTGFANFEESIVRKTDLVPFLLEDELKKRGAMYSKAFFPFAAHVVTDGRLVTGQNPGSATGVAEAVVRVLAQSRPAPGKL